MVVRELTFVMVLFIISYDSFLLEVVSLDLILIGKTGSTKNET